MANSILSGTTSVNKTGFGKNFPVKSITETIINGFFTTDRRWTVLYWNKAAEKLLGVKAADIVGKNLWESFVGIIPLDFYTVYPKAFLLELPFHFEEYWGEMGAWFDVIVYHCNDTLSISFKSSNQVPSDHPDHPEQRLKIENELYRFITEVSNDSLWEWDIKTNELFWLDGGHKKVFGYDIENAYIPRDFWASRIHPEDKVRVLEKLEQVVHDGASVTWEDDYRFQKVDGTYAYVHDNGYVIFDDNKQPARMIGTTLDVTEGKLCAIKLTETEEKLAKIEYRISEQGELQSDSKGRNNVESLSKAPASPFKSDVAHGIKNSLANISLSVEMLSSVAEDKDLKIFIDIILNNTRKISDLVNDNVTPKTA